MKIKFRLVALFAVCVGAFSLSAQTDEEMKDMVMPYSFTYHGDSACFIDSTMLEAPVQGTAYLNLCTQTRLQNDSRHIFDILTPFLDEENVLQIKGVAAYLGTWTSAQYDDIFEYDSINDTSIYVGTKKKLYRLFDSLQMNYYLGIADEDTNMLQSAKMTINFGKPKLTEWGQYAWGYAYFDETVEIPAGELFFTVFESPKPNADSLKYNWNAERYDKFKCSVYLKGVNRTGYPYFIKGEIPQTNYKISDLSCYFTSAKIFNYDINKGFIDTDTNWQVLTTGNKMNKGIWGINPIIRLTPITTFYVFPILGEVELDTVIKGGWTMQGDTLATYDSIIKGDTTILKSTFIVCDTIIAPDTMTTTKNGKLVDILQTGDTTISCDTLITYDTTINASIKQIDAGTLDRYSMLQPNPADKEVSVFSSFPIHKIEIYTYEGKKLDERRVASTNTVEGIDVSQYPSGTYFVVLHTSHGKVSKKLVIK